jgi:hypothetical protein
MPWIWDLAGRRRFTPCRSSQFAKPLSPRQNPSPARAPSSWPTSKAGDWWMAKWWMRRLLAERAKYCAPQRKHSPARVSRTAKFRCYWVARERSLVIGGIGISASRPVIREAGESFAEKTAKLSPNSRSAYRMMTTCTTSQDMQPRR